MTGVTHAHHPVRQQVLRDPPPSRSPLMRFVMTIAIALAACSIALPAAASADVAAPQDPHERPQTQSVHGTQNRAGRQLPGRRRTRRPPRMSRAPHARHADHH